MTEPDEIPAKPKKLTPKEKRFCEEYMIDFNATRAARAAGYSEKSARAIGYENLTKPHIRDYINQKLKEKSLKAEETAKLITDIAKSSLNDFFTIRKIEHTPRIIKTLKELIADLNEEIKFEDEYAKLVTLNEKEIEYHQSAQEHRRRAIIKYKLELKRDPGATRIVDGKTVLIDHAELDMVKLVQAKESGRIKSISHTQFGVKVEMYAADAALIAMARMHGLFIDKTEITGKDGEPLPKQVIIINGKEIEF
jgi:phage terminase small subunit